MNYTIWSLLMKLLDVFKFDLVMMIKSVVLSLFEHKRSSTREENRDTIKLLNTKGGCRVTSVTTSKTSMQD